MATRKYKALTPAQKQGIILKMEDRLNDRQIGERLGISPQGVWQWWRQAHIKREMGRIAERYREDVLPEVIQRLKGIQEKALDRLEAQVDGTGPMTVKEATEIIRTMESLLDNRYDKVALKDQGREATAVLDDITKLLTPDELVCLARRVGGMAGKRRLALVDPPLVPAIVIEQEEEN